MKKLLSLLSVLTISGTAVPTTIAASPYQKETKLNSNINYQAANSLETLNRNKRSWNSQSRNENRINSKRFWNGKRNYWPWFSRDNWIKIQKIYKESNTYDVFEPKFINIIDNINFDENECPRDHYWKIAKAIWNDFSTINNKYNSSKINYGLYMEIWNDAKLNKNSVDLQCFSNCPNNSWYKEKIKFLGLSDNYKGEIGLDTDSKKILFFGNDNQFHSYFNGTGINKAKIYNKIIIKNENNKVIKEIIINGTDSMQDIVNKYNLQNGINYDYGYNIEIWSAEPKRTHFILDDRNDYFYFVVDNPRLQKFIIINDKLLQFDFYQKQYFGLLLEWQENFKTWKNELNRQIKEDVPSFSIEQKRTWKGDKYNQLIDKIHSWKQDFKIIENSENINKIKHRITKLQDDINVLKNKIDELYNKVEEIKNSSNSKLTTCSNTFGLISPIASLYPLYGTAVSAITGIISASCTIANT